MRGVESTPHLKLQLLSKEVSEKVSEKMSKEKGEIKEKKEYERDDFNLRTPWIAHKHAKRKYLFNAFL